MSNSVPIEMFCWSIELGGYTSAPAAVRAGLNTLGYTPCGDWKTEQGTGSTPVPGVETVAPFVRACFDGGRRRYRQSPNGSSSQLFGNRKGAPGGRCR